MSRIERDPHYEEGARLTLLEWVNLGREQKEKLQQQIRETKQDPSCEVEDILRCNESDEDFSRRRSLLDQTLTQTADEIRETLGKRNEDAGIGFVDGSLTMRVEGNLRLSANLIIFFRYGDVSQIQYRQGIALVIEKANKLFVNKNRKRIPKLPLR